MIEEGIASSRKSIELSSGWGGGGGDNSSEKNFTPWNLISSKLERMFPFSSLIEKNDLSWESRKNFPKFSDNWKVSVKCSTFTWRHHHENICGNTCNGQIHISAQNGVEPYSILWNDSTLSGFDLENSIKEGVSWSLWGSSWGGVLPKELSDYSILVKIVVLSWCYS